ncbi:MAG TPA: phospholipase [Planctomycetaceae bacterium]|nr:phospholipase [Planctomycetaceae bacterium]
MSSGTNTATETLRTLHRIHRQLTDLRTRLRHGPQLVRAHEVNVGRCSDELAKRQERAKRARVACDAKQGQLRDGEEKIKKVQNQLNTAASNREYQLLKEQIAATEMANSVLADEIIEGLEVVDECSRLVVETEAQLAKTKAQCEQVKLKVGQERPSIEGDIARLELELAEVESFLPDDFKPLYRRAVNARGEEALAALRGEYCTGCNHKIPINDINKLMKAEPKPLICKPCGRLLYVPEDWSQE